MNATVEDGERVGVRPCDLCSAGSFSPLLEKGDYAYVTCDGCGLVRSDYRMAELEELYDGLFEDAWLSREIRRTLDARKQAIYTRQLERLSKLVGRGPVLDLGCGVGGFLESARALGLESHGVEVSQVAVAHARELGLSVACAEIGAADLKAGHFAIVRANALLEHLHEPRACLEVAHRALRPGGCVFGLTLNIDSTTFRRARERWRYLGMGGHVTLFRPEHLRRYLSSVGFRDIRVWTTGFREERRQVPRFIQNVVGYMAGFLGRGHRLYFRARRAEV